MTYVQPKGLSGKLQIYCAETRIPRIFSATATRSRSRTKTEDLLKNHRWFIHAGYRRACRRASSRKLGEQKREEGKGGANGIDPSLVVNAVAMAIDTRCQERTNRSELQPRLRTTRRARIRPQSFCEITGNAIAAITLGDAFN